MDDEGSGDDLWPWEREQPDEWRITVRLTDPEWAVIEEALERIGTDQALEIKYRIGEQTGSN